MTTLNRNPQTLPKGLLAGVSRQFEGIETRLSPGQAIYLQAIELSKQPIRTRSLGHVIGYKPIRDQYFLTRSVPMTGETHRIRKKRIPC